MIKRIKCKCGNDFPLNYAANTRKQIDVKWYHLWQCEDCGQQYLEEIKNPIIIKYNENMEIEEEKEEGTEEETEEEELAEEEEGDEITL